MFFSKRKIGCKICLVLLLCSLQNGILCATIRCYKGTFSNFQEVLIEDPCPLISSTKAFVDVSKPSLMFVFGYNGNPHGFAVSTLIPAFLALGKYNVFLLDWMEEASGGLAGPLFGYPLHAVPNTEKVGRKLGRALLKLMDLGMRKDLHIIGHSLGAHLACYAGRETQSAGVDLPWITALDPAKLEFGIPISQKPIDPLCATFVDVVHCDPGGYGMNASVGHLDFWPNYGQFINGSRLQPGCKILASPLDLFVNGNFCNHNRCIELYNSSLVNPQLLEGEHASSFYAWLKKDNYYDSNFIGLTVNKQKSGNFFLTTTSNYPFGIGAPYR